MIDFYDELIKKEMVELKNIEQQKDINRDLKEYLNKYLYNRQNEQ